MNSLTECYRLCTDYSVDGTDRTPKNKTEVYFSVWNQKKSLRVRESTPAQMQRKILGSGKRMEKGEREKALLRIPSLQTAQQ